MAVVMGWLMLRWRRCWEGEVVVEMMMLNTDWTALIGVYFCNLTVPVSTRLTHKACIA